MKTAIIFKNKMNNIVLNTWGENGEHDISQLTSYALGI
ncbi:hypothetical protein THERMOT_718 [Bathymodiolus thermophilus thioautotrophic gill symbiont]|uniref:Uncharacterized protein n=1 Tax=Bathymodiolus thermophilus thioautotrophic gill symbiont TaxID=2360 RepID=A0A8H8XEY9_9GAMM|nr:hypothetical protein THERMOT_718 [Bathymodiolus thermophilus thioautotrophic gill symbiont]CAB5505800.1 hypothetical protein THERMOS_2188 [Bathymodiolus thermophilus thioautotrophic gill symbiont]